MAKIIYDGAYTDCDTPGLGWISGTIKPLLVKSTYVVSRAHLWLSDILAGHRIGSLGDALTGKTFVAGVLDANDGIVRSVTTGQAIFAVILLRSTGVEGTSRLIAYSDEALPLPYTTDGVMDITLIWGDGATKIGKL